MRSAVPWITALLIIAGDRVTKMMVTSRLQVGEWLPVFPGLTITHVHNRGIAFSLFADGGWLTRVLIHAMILTAVVLIAWMLVHHHHRGWAPGLGFGLILGGAIGNLIDRVLHGYVVDFIHVWARVGERQWAWPDFNVADSAISVGACLLILFELRGADSRDEDDHAPDTD